MLIRDIIPIKRKNPAKTCSGWAKILSLLVVIFLITQFFVGIKGSAAEFLATKRTDSANNFYGGSYPQLQVDGTKIYYTFLSTDEIGNDQIGIAEMNTNGTNWSHDLRTTTTGYDNFDPQFQVVGSKIYYIWYQPEPIIGYFQIWTGEMNTDGTGWSATKRTTSTYTKLSAQLQVVGTKIYYIWVECDGTQWTCSPGKYQIWTAEMNTDGTGWSATQRTTSAYTKSYPQFQVVDSKIYYVWYEADSSSKNQIWTAEMNTDGTGWTATQQTTSAYSKSFPQLQVEGTKIYYVWYESDGMYYQIWTAEMNTDGTGWQATQQTTTTYQKNYPQLQVAGTKIYYIWRECSGTATNCLGQYYQIWTAEMNTDGSGWLATQRTTSTFSKARPQFQVDGPKIYYTWYESTQIWTAEMNTDGTGWTATQRTRSDQNVYDNLYTQLQVVGTKIYYLWSGSDITGIYQIWTAEMNINGSGWDYEMRTTSGNGIFDPQLQVVGSKIYYVWDEFTGSNFQIWTAEMDTDGTGWSTTQRTTSAFEKLYPQFQVVGTKIYYVWQESDGTYYQIWTAEMNIDGSGWVATQRTTSAFNKSSSQLQVVDNKIYYVWTEGQIWTAEMNTDGTGWAATQRTTSPQSKNNPQLQVVGTKTYYAWNESDGSKQQIWTAEMNTDGTDWLATQRTTSATTDQQLPQFQVVGTKIYYTWYDWDGSLAQIWTAETSINGSGWLDVKRTNSLYGALLPQLQVTGSRIYYVWSEYNDIGYGEIWTAEIGLDLIGISGLLPPPPEEVPPPPPEETPPAEEKPVEEMTVEETLTKTTDTLTNLIQFYKQLLETKILEQIIDTLTKLIQTYIQLIEISIK